MGVAIRWLARAVTWPLVPCLLIAALRLGAGADFRPADLPYLAGTVSCWLVAVVLTGRAFGQPAGWAYLCLGTAMAWSAFTEASARRAVSRGDGAALAVLADSSWLWWFVFLALALVLTPPRRPGRLRRVLPWLTAGSGAAAQLLMLLRPTPLEPPFDGVRSPWTVTTASNLLVVSSRVVVVLLGLCVLASIGSLVGAWRNTGGSERRQLLWLVAGVVPLAPAVIVAFVASFLGAEDLAGWVLSAAIVTTALGAAFSVTRYRLYDVERVLSGSVAYALAAGAVVVAFALVVVVISRTTPLASTAQLSTILATLAGVAVARQSYLWGRRAVDRRLDRRRFDAVDAIRAGLQAEAPDLDALLARALGDPQARVLYPASDGSWVTAAGQAARPAADTVDVRRAKLEFDPDRVDREIVEAAAREAAAEIDNIALRAELARQIEVVTESRARLATAHLDERRRMERDLHDGAQQRLLALALQLQSARINGRTDVLRAEVERAVAELGVTVAELRDLAAGLQPAALAGGGLPAAVEELAGRTPLESSYEVDDGRYPAAIEAAAWFVIAEAVANAVKHSGSEQVRIRVAGTGAALTVEVSDTGRGGADPHGSGLQGLADRVSALGGTLTVTDGDPAGTTVRAVFPCAS